MVARARNWTFLPPKNAEEFAWWMPFEQLIAVGWS
jgi:hypothetical protein